MGVGVVVRKVSREGLLAEGAAVVQVGLDGAEGDLEGGGDFVVLEFLEVEEAHDLGGTGGHAVEFVLDGQEVLVGASDLLG